MKDKIRSRDAMFWQRAVDYLRRKLGIYYRRSYAQCGEDLIVKYIFNALNVARPSYLDIGAHHPYFLSNTYLFYRQGSRGVTIEPDPELYGRIRRARRRDTNLNAGLGSGRGSLQLHIFASRTLNTFSAEEAERYVADGHQVIDTAQIDILTFEDVMERYCQRVPDFVSLDVEGMDVEILQSIDFSRFQPTVFCIETITFSTSGEGRKLDEIDRMMEQRGYLKYADTYINSIYVLKDRWVGR